jgi:hypothetical protein
MTSLTREERRAVARRVFAALCARYPERYVTLVEQPGPDPSATTFVDCSMAENDTTVPRWRTERHSAEFFDDERGEAGLK